MDQTKVISEKVPRGRLRFLALTAILLLVTYFYAREFQKVPFDTDTLVFSLDSGLLVAALLLCITSYLFDALIWQMVLNAQPENERKMSYRDVAVVLFCSGLLRYVPGRVWTFSAQIAWMGRFGVRRGFPVLINLLCVVQLLLFSVYGGLIYLFFYTEGIRSLAMLVFVVLVAINLIALRHGDSLVKATLRLAGRMLKRDIAPFELPSKTLAAVQLAYIASWILLGIAVFFLARGLGLAIPIEAIIPVVVAMSCSWLAGYLVIVAPAGLGVREGAMLMLLKPVLVIQTALLLPIISRLLLVLVELLMGLYFLVVGIRNNAFTLSPLKER